MNEASRAQIRAADPRSSSWVVANAGSGKTRVLTNRVARLLLAGCPPQKILCLTFTKTAASEMLNRLFDELGTWAMSPKDKLQEVLQGLGEDAASITPERLRQARRLFAAALETPGGLKIQTIHSFCDSLLRRFPFEAGVSPQFVQLDEAGALELRHEALRLLAQDTPERLEALLRHQPSLDLAKLVQGLKAHEAVVVRPEAFGITAPMTLDDVLGEVLLGGEEALLMAFIPVLRASGVNDKKLAQAFAAMLPFEAQDAGALLLALEAVLLFKTGEKASTAKIGKLPTQPIREAHPALMDQLEPLMLRVEAARQKRLGAVNFQKTLDYRAFHHAFSRIYTALKAERLALDYDDLIMRGCALLREADQAAWVLYKLDGGLDHILVDEAQDTSAAQWEIVAALSDAFSADQPGEHAPRTLFVVGDEKQSIYSFQGADPAEFGRRRSFFGSRLEERQQPLQESELLYSFRSSPVILSLVDQVLSSPRLIGGQMPISHRAFHETRGGRVELWPFIEAADTKDDAPWDQPVDQSGEDAAEMVLAQNIAHHIKELITQRIICPGTERPVSAGDILILVRRRKALYEALFKALKREGLPVAGADRVTPAEEIAVRDVMSLLRFLDTPNDDLSLAEALRSPLFGLSEGQLYRLAHGRKGSLWEALRQTAEHQATSERLRKLLRAVDLSDPFDLISDILIAEGGRKQLRARLGAEVDEPLDALVERARQYCAQTAATLTGFITWFSRHAREIKRELSGGTDEIRIMTVHGAKGLEAPIVILPETQNSRKPNAPQLLRLEDEPVGEAAAEHAPQLLSHSWGATNMESRSHAEEAAVERYNRLQDEEGNRLLYVGLTRAENYLIICGAGPAAQAMGGWYQRVREAMLAAKARPEGEKLILGDALSALKGLPSGDGEGLETRSAFAASLAAPLPRLEPEVQLLSPSELGGAKVMPEEQRQAAEGDLGEAARKRGTELHRLLEHLPHHPATAHRELVAQLLPELAPEGQALRLEEVSRLLNDPALGWVFRAPALTEARFVAPAAASSHTVYLGDIDRLIWHEGALVVLDYKSNRITPEKPEEIPLGLLRQMAAYVVSLKQIFPETEVKAAILWIETGLLMEIPVELLLSHG